MTNCLGQILFSTAHDMGKMWLNSNTVATPARFELATYCLEGRNDSFSAKTSGPPHSQLVQFEGLSFHQKHKLLGQIWDSPFITDRGVNMAKRFTETGKWDKSWFRNLPHLDKCVWMFLCDRCDHAGVWEIDDGAWEYFIGAEYSVERVLSTFGDRVERHGDKLLVRSFVEYQYGHLNPENRVHKSVLERLAKVKNKGLVSPIQGAKDKDTDKDTDKDRLFKTSDDLKSAISILDAARWAKDYPDPDWFNRQIDLCFEHFSAEPKETPRTKGKWMQKLRSWLENNWPKRRAEIKQASGSGICGVVPD